jgi:hypothetical protein
VPAVGRGRRRFLDLGEFENKERDLNRLFRQLQGRLLWVDRDG